MDTLITERRAAQTSSHIESEYREKRDDWAKVGLALASLRTALEDMRKPIWTDEARAHNRAIYLAADTIEGLVSDLKDDLTEPFFKRVSAAGLSREDYEIKMEVE